MKNESPTQYDPTEPYCDHLMEAAKFGPRSLHETNMQYGRTILDVAEEVGGIDEREQQLKIVRRGPVWLATSLIRMDTTYPGVAAYISGRVQELKETPQ